MQFPLAALWLFYDIFNPAQAMCKRVLTHIYLLLEWLFWTYSEWLKSHWNCLNNGFDIQKFEGHPDFQNLLRWWINEPIKYLQVLPADTEHLQNTPWVSFENRRQPRGAKYRTAATQRLQGEIE